LLTYRDQLYFVATDETHGTELYRTDGTGAGTALVGDLNPGKVAGYSMPIAVLGDDLLLFGTDGFHGIEPWKYTAP
jgi:ELWxxDGT repeat protein